MENQPEEMVERLRFPVIQGMMTGVSDCFQRANGIIQLTYEDGTIESRQSEKRMLEFGSLFGIVTFVQDGRKPNAEPSDEQAPTT
jgi:hypothetical protein